MSGRWRLLLIAAGAVAAVVLFVVLRGGDDDESASPPPPPPLPARTSTLPQPPPPPPPANRLQIVSVNASSGSITRVTVERGQQVLLIVRGPAGEEVHLHGYDVSRAIAANGTARLPFRATIPGRFEVELEGAHTQIADVSVR